MATNDDLLYQLSKSLNQLVKMNAYTLLQSEEWVSKSNGEKIYFLHQMNFDNEDISTMIGTTLGTVKKEISNRKKQENIIWQ